VNAGEGSFANPSDGKNERRRSHIDIELGCNFPHRTVSAAHLLVQLRVDPLLVPSELLDVLRPFEIADGDATRVGKNVWDD
jgi:hypothetical protein